MDETLEKIEEAAKSVRDTWSNYQHIYGWEWDEKTYRPVIIEADHSMIKRTCSVMLRDWTIGYELKNRGIKKVLDIGSDTGHFMAVLKALGIEAVGIDSNRERCDYINQRGINKCYNVGIESLLNGPLSGFDCITCLNIIHVRWPDEEVKKKFVGWMLDNSQYYVLSDLDGWTKKNKRMRKIFDFNFLPFRFTWLVYKIFGYLKIADVVTYTCMHKLYQKKDA